MSKNEASLLDFLTPYKFHTTFREDGVEHTYGGGDVVRGMSDVGEVEGRSTELWINIECIGNGGFGSVWLQKEAPSGINRRFRAVKRIDRGRTKSAMLLRELRSMITVRDCEHVVKCFGWYEDQSFYFIAMEYAEHGDLNQYLKRSKPALEQAKEITYQILKGLTVVHDKGICHRDLKLQNVLVTSLRPIHIKLADFGVSKCEEGTELRTKVGTEGYLAPELLGTLPLKFRPRGSKSYTKAVDIWALGCIIYNLLTLEAPFLVPAFVQEETMTGVEEETTTGVEGGHQRELDIGLLYKYCNGENHILTGSLQALGVAEREILLVNRFLAVDPKSRISAAAALVDPWFSRPSYAPDYDVSLIQAARDGHIDRVHIYLSAGANVQGTDDMKNSALHLAAMHGHYSIVKTLLDHNADLSAVDAEHWTPLHRAASEGHIDIVELLLEVNADVSAVDAKCWTPLHRAVSEGHTDIVRLLLEAGTDMRVRDDEHWTPLHLAALEGHIDIVELLLEKGADMSVRDADHWTPLHLAASEGHKLVVRLLLESGADMSVRDAERWTPLHRAASEGHIDIVELLLEVDADLSVVDAVDAECWTPLHRAASEGHIDIVRLLLEAGADMGVRDAEHWTPLHLATLEAHTDIVQLFLDEGADVSVESAGGWTPLHCAASVGHELVARLLLRGGADIGARDARGWNPIRLATSKGHTNIVHLLMREMKHERAKRSDPTTEG